MDGSVVTTPISGGSGGWKTVSNSGDLNENNMGNKLLKAMGWKEGEGIGKNNVLTAPIEVQKRTERTGIGMETDTERYDVEPGDSYQIATKKKARARFEALMGTDFRCPDPKKQRLE